MSSENLALDIAGLSYSYKSNWLGRSQPALKAFSLQVHTNEIFGFLGHNGAGKTTTIKCILNLIKPGQGSVKIFGRESWRAESRALVGYLPEQPYFYDHLSVEELLQFYAALAGVPRDGRGMRVREALARVGMSERTKVRLGTLSKGLIQRVALAQAIVGQPKLLILDEPFSGLDPVGRKQFRDLIEELRNSGVTVFMSSHVLSDVEYLCDRVSIMVKGELRGVYEVKDLAKVSNDECELVLEYSAALDNLLRPLAGKYVKHGATVSIVFANRDVAEAELKLLINAGARVVSFGSMNNALENLFMRVLQEG